LKPNPKREAALEKFIEKESTNFQWAKLGLNWGMILILIVISILRGSGDNSPVGIMRCDKSDWKLYGLL